jgi:hypothetical protein
MAEHAAPRSGHARWITLGALIVVGLIVVPLLAAATDDNPQEWLATHYQHVSGDDPDAEAVVFRSDDPADQTARDVEHGTGADERRQEGTLYLVRYDSDWMVVVRPEGAGARIELYEFDRGYRQYGAASLFWSDYYGRGGIGFFRGGGTGFGK